MFKLDSFAQEVKSQMNKNLISNANADINKLSRAIDLLDAAASIFEQNGLPQEAELITDILTQLADKIINLKSN